MSYAGHGYGITNSVVGFVAAYGLGILTLFPEGVVPAFIYTIVEEIRIAVINEDNRDLIMNMDDRDCPIMFENRTVVVPIKGD